MLGSLRETAARADLRFVALALAVYVVSVPLVALRWRTVLRGVTGRLAPLGTLVLATLASGFVNNMTPAARLGGEACRVITLVRLKLATTSQAAAAAAYERLMEVPAVAVIAMATLFVVGRLSFVAFHPATLAVGRTSKGVTVALALALTVVVASGLAYLVMRAARGRDGAPGDTPGETRGTGARRGLRERWNGFRSIAVTPSALAASALISAAIWTIDVVRLRLAAAAFGAPIDMAEAATLTAITIVAGWVPTIGGLGAIEGGLIAGLVGMGVPTADAIAITAVERAISYGVGSLAGFVSLSLLGGRSLWRAVRVGAPVPEGAIT